MKELIISTISALSILILILTHVSLAEATDPFSYRQTLKNVSAEEAQKIIDEHHQIILRSYSDEMYEKYQALSSVECGSLPTDRCIITNDTTFISGYYNLTIGITIGADNITLDCNGSIIEMIIPPYYYFNENPGIFLYSRKNVTVKNCIVKKFDVGIFILNSSSVTLENNSLINNTYNFRLEGEKDEHFNNSVDISNTADNKSIYYIKNAKNIVYGKSSNASTFYCSWCFNITIENLNFSKNGFGIYLWKSSNMSILNNSLTNNWRGLWMIDSSNNTIVENIISRNAIYGVYLKNSYSNKFLSNTVSQNEFNYAARGELYRYGDGFVFLSSANTTINNNQIEGNFFDGIFLWNSSGSIASNNILHENYFGISVLNLINIIVENNTFISNLANGIYLNSANMSIFDKNKISGSSIVGAFQLKSSSENIFIKNSLAFNGLGFYLYLNSIQNKIENNNILNNSIYAFRNSQSINVTAEYNWWGTTNTTEIAKKIYDYYDYDRYGIVDYDPWLVTPFSELYGEINSDCTVNIFDLATVAVCFGEPLIDNCQDADLNDDDMINLLDLAYIATNFGKKCWGFQS